MADALDNLLEASEEMTDLLITNRVLLDDDALRDAAIRVREAVAEVRADLALPAGPKEETR